MRFLLCSPRLHLFDPKYIKNSNIVEEKDYSSDDKASFLQSLVSHDPSEIISKGGLE